MDTFLSPEDQEGQEKPAEEVLNTPETRRSDAGDSSQSSHDSPTLSPSKNPAMTSSIISNLNLSSDEGDDQKARSDFGTSRFGTTDNGRVKPLTAKDLLDQSASSSSSIVDIASSGSTPKLEDGAFQTNKWEADKTAPDIPMDTYESKVDQHPSSSQRESQTQRSIPSDATSTPSRRDASLGLDPDADTIRSIQGRPFRPASSSLSTHRHHHNSSSSSSHVHSRSLYEEGESLAPSHATAATGAPKTSETHSPHTQTVPSVSATGMPRFLPRRTSRSPSADSDSIHSSYSSHAPAPHEMMPAYPPSGSLTIAIFAKGISWRRRGYLLLASIAINIGLPFINGVMLGFGEIFARTIVAPYIGLTPAAINVNAPGPRRANAANTGGGGLRYAGVAESQGSGGQRVPIESWEVEAGQKGKGRSRMI